jgi:predicted Na+-dependent transporter
MWGAGMSLKSRVLAQAATRLPLHILIQILSLGLTPAIGYGIAYAMRKAPWMNQDLVSGFIVSLGGRGCLCSQHATAAHAACSCLTTR